MGSEYKCPITGDTVDPTADEKRVVYHQPNKRVETFATRAGLDQVEDYIRDEYEKYGAYSIVDHWGDGGTTQNRLFTIEGDPEQFDDDADVELKQGVDLSHTNATERQRQMYREMAGIIEADFRTFVEKNLDYGSSFLTAGEVDMELSGGQGPFDSVNEANLYKLFTRIQDKNQRFYKQAFCEGSNLVGENLAETAGDAAVYWLMVQWLCEHKVQA